MRAQRSPCCYLRDNRKVSFCYCFVEIHIFTHTQNRIRRDKRQTDSKRRSMDDDTFSQNGVTTVFSFYPQQKHVRKIFVARVSHNRSTPHTKR